MKLPAGRAEIISRSLAQGDEPEEEWCEGDKQAHGGVWECRFVSVHGESHENPDGASRQSVLRLAKPGCEAYLIPEPTNKFDPDAIAVYLDLDGEGQTGQIGYLTRGSDVPPTTRGDARAWLANKGRSEKGTPLGAALYVVIEQSPMIC